ncbi:hypothetical protein [Thiovibrio frasassiensis]|uniref:Uncharacterized protein n=1 Tax=Thiovibrio frasassiensis TaxID=2984131 RepID=A0A9X4ME96_9BACT|nr:hypothetical protein [Thiovibrio frasassiensis]MDG4474701.1 hypothetical protein [Thiovibrio frasassiensis]
MAHDSAPLAAILSRFRKIGIIGIPPLAVIRTANEHGLVIHDLDEPLVREDLETASPFLPRVYCAILRTAVVNALHLELDAIYVDTGPGKCDCALHTATILAEALPIPVISTKNMDSVAYGTPLCQACLPLTARMVAITAGVKSAAPYDKPMQPCLPTAAFWGVPPRDFSILDLFPATTHIYGWARCMENKTPADHELEALYNPQVPTVFFAQSFCAKTALARYLAKKHPHALYLDVDVHTSSSARAKVQAFLELSGVHP